MSLSFETSSFNSNSTPSYSNGDSGVQKSFMVAFLMKKGIVKTESAGNAILLVFALAMIALSGYMMYNTLSGGNTSTSVPVETKTVETVGEVMNEN